MSGEKTEKPTPKKKRDSQREGQIVRTPELGSWSAMLVVSVLLPMIVRKLMALSGQLMIDMQEIIRKPDQADAMQLFLRGMKEGTLVGGTLIICILLAGFVAAVAQGGLKMATKLLIPKFSRLNPVPGLKRNFGPQSLWELTKNLIKVGVIVGVLYFSVRKLIPVLMASGSLPLRAVMDITTDTAISCLRTVAVAGLIMAIPDYLIMRQRIGKKIKMSKNDVKDEYKKSEGDPQVKGQIRARQHAMSRNRMMSEMSTADVVVVNPEHVAVALRYNPADGAPKVVAKGAGTIAAKIREKATEYRIPMIQDVPLARAMHAGCEIGQPIPMEFYGAVAKVLAFVMSLKARGSAAGVHRQAAS